MGNTLYHLEEESQTCVAMKAQEDELTNDGKENTNR